MGYQRRSRALAFGAGHADRRQVGFFGKPQVHERGYLHAASAGGLDFAAIETDPRRLDDYVDLLERAVDLLWSKGARRIIAVLISDARVTGIIQQHQWQRRVMSSQKSD